VIGVCLLKSNCGAHRVRGTLKFSEQSIATDLVDLPTVLPNRLGKALESVCNALVSPALVELDQHSRADHIGVEDDCERTCRLVSHK
jgi:hypothetical protein